MFEPDTDVDPYGLMQTSDVVLVYTSTVGMEATYFGTPAVTAPDSHYGKKGFRYGPEAKEEIPLGKRYLYNYFIERSVNLDLVRKEPYSSEDPIVQSISSVEDLKSGGNQALDNICRSIIEDHSYPYIKKHKAGRF